MIDARRFAPATERNRDPILQVLQRYLPEMGVALEIASGTGEHAIHFARGMPLLIWQPSDPDAESRASIDAWAAGAGRPNLRAAIDLDAAAPVWPVTKADAIVCINMVHISPWASAEGLVAGAGRLLAKGSPLILYGPYRQQGVPIAPGNEAFDNNLKERDSRWGLRDLETVVVLADDHGLILDTVIEMPSNNLSVIFRKI
jgi:hypothetical protein